MDDLLPDPVRDLNPNLGIDPDLDIEAALPDAPFVEVHSRIVDRAIDQVWPACLDVTVGQVRTLGPLMAVRGLPRLLRRTSDGIEMNTRTPLLEAFAAEGFVLLRRDEQPVDGFASVLFGATGKFWSITENMPVAFDGLEAFLAFDEPGYATTVCRLEAFDLGDGRTRIETETRVVGTDPASTRKFAPYWAVIRLPSGLIRRSWLAGIDRRARHQAGRA